MRHLDGERERARATPRAGSVGAAVPSPLPAGAAQVLHLQRTAGNQATCLALGMTRSGTATLLRQPKATDLESRSSHAFSIQRNTSGAQLDVQTKMAEITRLFRAKELQGKKPPEHEEEEQEAYAKELAINGLCGGWATLFMQYPDWVEPVYNAVRTWNRPSEISDLDALEHFEDHLVRVTKFTGAESVVELVRRAYVAMSDLEPTAGYNSQPKWTDKVELGTEPPVSETAKESARTEESTIHLRGRSAAKLVCTRLEQLTRDDKPGELMAHIESDLHHMAVRVQKTRRGGRHKLGLLITVVETEKKGMVKVESWEKAEQILDGWLGDEEPDLRKVALRTRTVDF